MHAVIAIPAALLRRAHTGEGEYLDVSVADGVLQLMALTVDEHLATDTAPGPRRDLLTGRYAFYDNYAAGDGKWLSVAAIEPRFWANLCRALDLEGWISHQYDDAVQEEIRADLRAAFAKKTRDEWSAELGPADTCVAPVREVTELLGDAQYRARGAFSQAVHPEHGAFRQVAPVLAGMERSATPVSVRGGDVSDTAELLRHAGVPDLEIEKLLGEGVLA